SNSAPELKASLPPPVTTSSKLPSGWKMEILISACSCSATCFPKRTNTTSSAFCRGRFLRPFRLSDSSLLTQATPRLPRRSSNTSLHPKPKRSGKKQGTSRIAEPRMAGRASRFILEKQLQRELDDARLRVGCAARGRNLTKSSAGERRIRITEQGQ